MKKLLLTVVLTAAFFAGLLFAMKVTFHLPGLLQPVEELRALQDAGNLTKLMVVQEELKTAPFGDVWNEYCRICGK
ncbi:MAG: L-rhamnose isomerase, partial [Clostridia bacterium]|nr:L-rhamnose isomerase [Clostridia bacterium]